MYEYKVQGEVQSQGWREGASGRLTGSLAGLFQGYRDSGDVLSGQHYLLATEEGVLALMLHRPSHLGHALPARPVEHPFEVKTRVSMYHALY